MTHQLLISVFGRMKQQGVFLLPTSPDGMQAYHSTTPSIKFVGTANIGTVLPKNTASELQLTDHLATLPTTRKKESCVLKAFAAECQLIPLTDSRSTFDQHLNQHLIDILIDTWLTLGRHLT